MICLNIYIILGIKIDGLCNKYRELEVFCVLFYWINFSYSHFNLSPSYKTIFLKNWWTPRLIWQLFPSLPPQIYMILLELTYSFENLIVAYKKKNTKEKQEKHLPSRYISRVTMNWEKFEANQIKSSRNISYYSVYNHLVFTDTNFQTFQFLHYFKLLSLELFKFLYF